MPLSISSRILDPFTLNALRNLLAALSLLILALIMKARKPNAEKTAEQKRADRKNLFVGGILCGLCISVGAILQQVGLKDTTAGKAAFISALYVVLVPVFGLFFRKKTRLNVWVGVLIAVVGLYFLCVTEAFTVAAPDIWIMVSAMFFGLHIIVVDRFISKTDEIWLAFVQFAAGAAITGAVALVFGSSPMSAVKECVLPLLYLGVIAHGGGFTLQLFAQKGGNPTAISLILGLESVVATIAGGIMLHERLSPREYLGCAFMLAAVVISQLPSKKKRSPERI